MSDGVILVERDPLVREGLRALLSAWGLQVCSGADPSEVAADGNPETAPRLAILSAPHGDTAVGVDWIAALRLNRRRLPIILVADESGGTFKLPDCVHIEWPAKAAQLRAAVTAIISARQAGHA